MKICVTQIGARNHYLTAEAFERSNMLAGLHTDLHVSENAWFRRVAGTLTVLDKGLIKLALSRMSKLDSSLVHSYPAAALLTLMRRFSANDPVLAESIDLKLGRLLARKTSASGFSAADAVYGYSGSSASLFQTARRQGLFTILDQASATIKTSTRLLADAAQRWEPTSLDQIGPMAGYRREEAEELELADLIIAPSTFVSDSLQETGVSEKKIKLIPYGYSPRTSNPAVPFSRSGPLRLLFVGNANLQKGLPVLLKAVANLPESDVELRIVGATPDHQSADAESASNVTYFGRIPRIAVDQQYEWADVIVVPSICEGMGIVQLEAMAKGVPVIRSTNTGDAARDGLEGIVVTAGSDSALTEAIVELINSRDQVAEYSLNALNRVSDFSLENYANTLVSTVSEHFTEKHA